MKKTSSVLLVWCQGFNETGWGCSAMQRKQHGADHQGFAVYLQVNKTQWANLKDSAVPSGRSDRSGGRISQTRCSN